MNRKFGFTIGGVAAIALAAGILGTITLTSIENNSSSPQTQSIGIGAWVIVEAYDKDGFLKQKFEGHNALSEQGINALVGCISGNSTDPYDLGTGCVGLSNTLQLELDDNPIEGVLYYANADTNLTLKPDGCDPDVNGNFCTGWELIAIYDFPTLPCGTDSCSALGAHSNPDSDVDGGFPYFNQVNFDSPIIISPDDRVKVNMTFNISP